MKTMRAFAVFLLLAAIGGSASSSIGQAASSPATGAPKRIVSLAPSVTELLFALGLGDRVVGVTSYCRYPAEALKISKIGGYLTPNFEALAATRSDLAIALPEHVDVLGRVEALGIPVLSVNHHSVLGILESATSIGERCGISRQAAKLRDQWQEQLDGVAATIAGRPRPRVVICLGRNADPSSFRSMSAAGPGGIYHDLIVRAGGINAIPPGPVLHPSLSAEALLQLDPDVIVEFLPGGGDPSRLLEGWKSLGSLRAVRTGRIVIFTQDFLIVPGPRLVAFVGELARSLHPGAPWRDQ
jgi:iron complex transport system substrate-binding protein